MAIQQIQKSSTFKPDMIGDVVEVTVYDKKDGTLNTAAFVLDGYVYREGYVEAFSTNLPAPMHVVLDEYTVSITHFEFILDLSEAGDDE